MIGLVPIGEMARSLGVAVVTLRRWERSGKLKPTLRTAGGHRRYGELAEPEREFRFWIPGFLIAHSGRGHGGHLGYRGSS